MNQPLLRLQKVSKSYPAAAGGEELTILREIDLEVATGQTIAIIGPSGSGKSTLLNIIGTLDRPTSGQVHLHGRDLTALNDIQLANVRNAEVGFIFQSHHLLPQCSVIENVLVPTLASTNRELRASAPDRARSLLERVGLAGRLDHRPGQLSGGERQRVAVVRALINQPKLLLADEPTGALDRASAETLAQLLADLNREQTVAMLVVTHSLELAQRMGTVYALSNQRLARVDDHP